jgi:hypothetical protein
MNRIAIAMIAAAILAISAQAQVAYKIVKEVALGAPDKWDFLYFDASARRIFVSHATQVDVVDADSGVLVGRIPGFDTSHGIVTVPSLGVALPTREIPSL